MNYSFKTRPTNNKPRGFVTIITIVQQFQLLYIHRTDFRSRYFQMLPTTLVTLFSFVLELCSSTPVYNMQPAYITANIGKFKLLY